MGLATQKMPESETKKVFDLDYIRKCRAINELTAINLEFAFCRKLSVVQMPRAPKKAALQAAAT